MFAPDLKYYCPKCFSVYEEARDLPDEDESMCLAELKDSRYCTYSSYLEDDYEKAKEHFKRFGYNTNTKKLLTPHILKIYKNFRDTTLGNIYPEIAKIMKLSKGFIREVIDCEIANPKGNIQKPKKPKIEVSKNTILKDIENAEQIFYDTQSMFIFNPKNSIKNYYENKIDYTTTKSILIHEHCQKIVLKNINSINWIVNKVSLSPIICTSYYKSIPNHIEYITDRIIFYKSILKEFFINIKSHVLQSLERMPQNIKIFSAFSIGCSYAVVKNLFPDESKQHLENLQDYASVFQTIKYKHVQKYDFKNNCFYTNNSLKANSLLNLNAMGLKTIIDYVIALLSPTIAKNLNIGEFGGLNTIRTSRSIDFSLPEILFENIFNSKEYRKNIYRIKYKNIIDKNIHDFYMTLNPFCTASYKYIEKDIMKKIESIYYKDIIR
jgi:hypothetical protein